MDARPRRSLDSLRAGVLALAARQPIADVTVSALCREAGVTRDTFYRYAETPVGLLADALGEELDGLSEGLPDHVAIGEAEAALLEHVHRRADVYRGAMQPLLAAPVRGNLERILRDGLLEWARLHPGIVPQGLADDALGMRMAASYAAAGTVGAIEEWLRAGAEDTDHAVEVILAASPEWWLR